MSGPWEDYQQDGPWAEYHSPQKKPRTVPKRPNAALDAATAFAASAANSVSDLLGTVVTAGLGPAMGDLAERGGNALGLNAPYQPQTRAGRYAGAVGEMAPNAVMGRPGPSMVRNALAGAANIVVPGLASEGARETASAAGAGRKGQAAARVAGAMAGGAAAGLRTAPRKLNPRAPSLDTLRANRSAAYEAVDNAGVKYKPAAVDTLIAGMVDEMASAKLNPLRHPKAASMLDEVRALKGSSPTLTELDQLRQVIARDVASATDPAERFFGQKMIANLDEFIDSAPPATRGNARAAAGQIKTARDLHKRVAKIETVKAAADKAELRTASTGSGGNIDNALRQNLRRVLETQRNLTPDERAALASIVRGGKGQNALRLVGKLSPTGNGLMTTLHSGMAGGAWMAGLGPLGVAPAVGGFVAKTAADAMTQRKVGQLIDLMARGGREAPKAQSELARMAKNPAVRRQILERMTQAGGVNALAQLQQR